VLLMGEKRRALHEEHGKRRHADVRHRELTVRPTALIRQRGAGLLNLRYQALKRPHTQFGISATAIRIVSKCQPIQSVAPTPMSKMRIARENLAGDAKGKESTKRAAMLKTASLQAGCAPCCWPDAARLICHCLE